MWVRSLKLKNFRSFEDAQLEFSNGINIIVGPNNAGKSTILRPLLGLQAGLQAPGIADIRIGTTDSKVDITFADTDGKYYKEKFEHLWYESHGGFALQGKVNNNPQKVPKLSANEPNNFIYPFVSKRKVTTLDEKIIDKVVKKIPSTFENLNAKIDRLSSPDFLPAHEFYRRACRDILGFHISTTSTQNGKRAAYTIHNMDNIPLLSMGEGVMNILGLVVHLAMAEKKKLFIIEELENDIHPKALKALLDLILEKATSNQFILTTHSNIVLKRLGTHPQAKIFKVDMVYSNRMPTSNVTEINSCPEDRRAVLTELGFELHDTDLWEGWLFLEESSAETIVREHLIPWFVPSLKDRLRTFSAHSLSEVVPKFRDFNDLFVFLHLEPAYKNRAWVLVDGGEKEQEIIEKMKVQYVSSGWSQEHFRQFTHHDFEDYYPQQFRDKFADIKENEDKQARRNAKKDLLAEVRKSISENEKEIRMAFKNSAKEVIEILKDIERRMS